MESASHLGVRDQECVEAPHESEKVLGGLALSQVAAGTIVSKTGVFGNIPKGGIPFKLQLLLFGIRQQSWKRAEFSVRYRPPDTAGKVEGAASEEHCSKFMGERGKAAGKPAHRVRCSTDSRLPTGQGLPQPHRPHRRP
ncbi:hypothetical protein SBA4_4600017 [Candidatus Sulfopaludibacter sp. SbA4]|nr:hypothetical protein SBA4_4600017 [Candidatus Sulfopaludibacter sp. SbA4]